MRKSANEDPNKQVMEECRATEGDPRTEVTEPEANERGNEIRDEGEPNSRA
ncbi:hypothetical protein GCM10020229_28580 [Kitasatospora albolonga]